MVPMDEKFRRMLEEAERIRAEGVRQGGDHRAHALHIVKMTRYGLAKGLLTGKVLEGTASEENLALVTEYAAGTLEFDGTESIGSVLRLSREEKIALNRRAKAKVERNQQLRRGQGWN